jgi:hypothetical protein
MSATELSIPLPRRRVPLSLRGAQALLFGPLGALQVVAPVIFLSTLHSTSWGKLVGAWAIGMGATGIVTAVRLPRQDASTDRLALAMLASEVAFATVKLTVYHESASLVFFGLTGVTGLLLWAGRR